MVIVRHNKCISPLARWFAVLGGLAEIQGKIGEVGPPVNGRLLLHFPLFALRAQRGVLLCEAPATADRSEKQMPKQQPSDQKTVTRKGSPPLKVYCLPSERDQITANAQAVGLTVSTYLLRVGAGYEIKSTLDSQLVAELAVDGQAVEKMVGLNGLRCAGMSAHRRVKERR